MAYIIKPINPDALLLDVTEGNIHRLKDRLDAMPMLEQKEFISTLYLCEVHSNDENNHSPGQFHMPVLSIAASNNHFDIVKLLIERGASINQMETAHRTAFVRAVEKKCYDVARYLEFCMSSLLNTWKVTNLNDIASFDNVLNSSFQYDESLDEPMLQPSSYSLFHEKEVTPDIDLSLEKGVISEHDDEFSYDNVEHYPLNTIYESNPFYLPNDIDLFDNVMNSSIQYDESFDEPMLQPSSYSLFHEKEVTHDIDLSPEKGVISEYDDEFSNNNVEHYPLNTIYKSNPFYLPYDIKEYNVDTSQLRTYVADSGQLPLQRVSSIDTLNLEDADTKIKRKKRPLITAIKNNDLASVKRLLKDPKVRPGIDNNKAIRLASSLGLLQIVKCLLRDARVDPSDMKDDAIRRATQNGHLGVFILLLEDYRVDPTTHENWCIRWASQNDIPEIVKFLLYDPRVNPATSSNAPIFVASRHGCTQVVKLLLEDIRVCPTDYALEWACRAGHLEVVELLLSDGRANPTANGNKPLIYACQNGHEEVVTILLKDPRVKLDDRIMHKALYSACREGHVGVVKLLLAYNREGLTFQYKKLLRVAAKKGHFQIVKLLLNHVKAYVSIMEFTQLNNEFKNKADIVKFLVDDSAVELEKKSREINTSTLLEYTEPMNELESSHSIDRMELDIPDIVVEDRLSSHEKPSHNHRIHASIDAKYFDGFRKYKVLSKYCDHILSNQESLTLKTIKTMPLKDLIKDSSQKSHKSISYTIEGSSLTLYTSIGDIQKHEKCVFVMAGRGGDALILPPCDMVRTVLVLTQSQYSQLKIPANIDALVINTLSSNTHGKFDFKKLGLLIPRRIATFLLAHHLGIENMVMSDDNIKAYKCPKVHSDLALTPVDVYHYQLQGLRESSALTVGLHTIRGDRPFRQSHERLGAKVIMFDMAKIKQLLAKPEHMFYLLPPAQCANWCNEDFFYLSMIHQSAESIGLQANAVLPVDRYGGIVRSRKHANLCSKNTTNAMSYLDDDFMRYIELDLIETPHVEQIKRTRDFLKETVQNRLKELETRKENMNLIQLHAKFNHVSYVKPDDCYYIEDINNKLGSLLDDIKVHLGSLAPYLRRHQFEAVRAIRNSAQMTGQMIMGTGSGKTFCQIALAHIVSRQEPIHIVTSSKRLVQQTYESFIHTFEDFSNSNSQESKLLKQNILKISSSAQDLSVNHLIDFSEQLKLKLVMIFCKESYLRYCQSKNFIAPQLVLLDEFHLASKEQLNVIISQPNMLNVPKYGLTATPPINSPLDLLYNYDRLQALKDGFVSPMIISRVKIKQDKFARYVLNCLNKTLHPNDTPLIENKGIVYVNSTKCADELALRLKSNNSSVAVYLVHSQHQQHKKELRDFIHDRGPCIALAVNMIREGVDIPNVNYILIARSKLKSEHTMQMAGRAMRLNQNNPEKICFVMVTPSLDLSNFEILADRQAFKKTSKVFITQELRQIAKEIKMLIKTLNLLDDNEKADAYLSTLHDRIFKLNHKIDNCLSEWNTKSIPIELFSCTIDEFLKVLNSLRDRVNKSLEILNVDQADSLVAGNSPNRREAMLFSKMNAIGTHHLVSESRIEQMPAPKKRRIE